MCFIVFSLNLVFLYVLFCIVFIISERLFNVEIWNICLLFREEVIKLSFFVLVLFLILIEKMCIFCFCSKLDFVFVLFRLFGRVFVSKIIILVVFVFLLLNIDICVYLSVLLVFVDVLGKYWMWFIFGIMLGSLENLMSLNIFDMELL